MRALILVSLLACTSCTAMREWAVKEAKTAATEQAAKILNERAPQEAVMADANKDGKTTWEEWQAWLASGGVTSVGLLLLSLLRGRKEVAESVAVLHKRADKRADVTRQLEKELAAIKASSPGVVIGGLDEKAA